MLTRLYIDNFRCFDNFEYKPRKRELILGANGSGKSSFLDALLLIRQFVVIGDVFDTLPILAQRTRWLTRPELTCELDASLDEDQYRYRLVLEPWGEPVRARVRSETLHLGGKPIFEFNLGEVHLYNDRSEHKVTYPFDWHRSGLATIMPRRENSRLTRFKEWISSLYCFRMNPFGMAARAEGESFYPNVDLSNIAAWYRHLVQSDPRQNSSLLDSLRASIDGFDFLQLEPAGENVRLLAADFRAPGTRASTRFFFNELSDGQRCLICLYTIHHFLLAKGSTIVLDEPDNFVSLPEVQPWLSAVTETIEDGPGQLFIISHHPETINQWAPGHGVRFVRHEGGPVRVHQFRGDAGLCISPAELVARGWESE